jgi:hypothetical protein
MLTASFPRLKDSSEEIIKNNFQQLSQRSLEVAEAPKLIEFGFEKVTAIIPSIQCKISHCALRQSDEICLGREVDVHYVKICFCSARGIWGRQSVRQT